MWWTVIGAPSTEFLSHGPVLEPLYASVRGAVIHDEDLEIGRGLLLQGCHAVRKEAESVVVWDDDGGAAGIHDYLFYMIDNAV